VIHDLLESPIGEVLVTADDDGALTGLWFADRMAVPAGSRRSCDGLAAVRAELDAYWEGTLREFSVPMRFSGTPFQRAVWEALAAVPYGTTLGYGALAARIGRPAAARAVGAANGQNPISVIVPCHRLIGSTGSLVKYGGGLERKRWLLEHESARIPAERGA
jgi:methylated-DNA-[protein]-cysteine S-methyltransferase